MENKEMQEVMKKGKKSLTREIFSWVACIVSAFVVAIVIKYFIFTPTLVQQRSMTPTILDGERVLINRLVRTFKIPVERGNIITFEKPDATEEDGLAFYNQHTGIVDFVLHDLLEITKVSYIKRVIGLGGDHVQITPEGEVYVNDRKLEEPYLPEGITTPMIGEFCDIIVPEGYLFVMGDNRGGSSDSRVFGCIPLEKVEGRVTFRIWPLTKLGKVDK